MYDVHIKAVIYGPETDDSWITVRGNVKLPFAPVPGYILEFDDIQLTLKTIYWDVEEYQFFCVSSVKCRSPGLDQKIANKLMLVFGWKRTSH